MFSGILITAYNQAELFIPATKGTLSLPAIPGSPRVWHTLTRNILCGGAYPHTSTNCLELSQGGGDWAQYNITLHHSRLAHSAWDSPSGIVLLGLQSSPLHVDKGRGKRKKKICICTYLDGGSFRKSKYIFFLQTSTPS